RPLFAGVAFAATAAAALLVWWLGRSGPGPLAGGGAPLASGATLSAPVDVPLSDGSRVVLEQGAALGGLADGGGRFVAVLRGGRCRFDVRPGGPRRWTIETDLATVEVVGTAFTVERGAKRLEVGVERGVVVVRGERVPGRVRRLTAGERVVVEEAV